MSEDQTDGDGLADVWLAGDIRAADAQACRSAAERAVAIATLARRRRAEDDRVFGQPGGPGLDSHLTENTALRDVSDSFVSELALARHCTENEAELLAVEAILLTTKLTGTWAALYRGRIDEPKMRALVDLLGAVKAETAAEIERRVLEPAESLTVPQLRARVRRLLARLDAEALEKRRARRQQKARVRWYSTGDGMGRLDIDLSLPDAAACFDTVDRYAQMMRADGDLRPIGMIRAAVARDLILRPWDTSRPPVTAHLDIHASLDTLSPAGTEPAEVNGEPVSAAQCRELLEQLDMLGIRQAPAGGCVQVAVHDHHGSLLAVATRRELRRAGSGSRQRRYRRRNRPARGFAREASVTGPGRHELADGESCDGPRLRPPPPTPRYRPTAEQQRFVKVRDRRCRWPGCRRRPGRCDLDHGRPYDEGGPTDCWNLCCLCRRHHRIKTFAKGWSFELLADGRLVVRTPSGVTRVTWPPGWCRDPEPDPPWVEEEAPPDPLLI